MKISKKGIIDNYKISADTLIRIRMDLKKGVNTSYEQIIVQQLSHTLSNRIANLYPELIGESTDIVADVFYKFRKHICKDTFELANFDFKELILFLFTAECQLAIPSKELIAKNLSLTRKDFKNLIRKLKDGDETIIEKIYLSHFKNCIKYLVHHCKSTFDDAYTSSMEALLEIRKDLIKGSISYGNLNFYFTKRAKSKWHKLMISQNKLQQRISIEELDIADKEKTESEINENELNELVREAIKKLCKDCKKIIRMYYFQDISLKEIAGKMNKSHVALRKQISRCRENLRTHVGENFYKTFATHFNK